ncbi:uncharacterized protein [Clytia hemisphaerica]|uniref:uncharacterized protein n=1 Tax=Clytia hemisphaerica TaxID=252671 RepID=UPI0034D66562
MSFVKIRNDIPDKLVIPLSKNQKSQLVIDSRNNTQDVARLQRMVQNLTTENAKLKLNVQSLSSDLSTSNKEVDSIKGEFGKLVKKSLIEKKKSSQERDSLSAKIADLNQELASLQNDLNISRGEKDDIKAELGKFIKKNLVQKQKFTEERDSLSAKIADLNQELASLQNDLNISHGEKDNIKAELGKLIKKNLVQKQKSIQERDSLSAKIADLNQELASLQNDLILSRGEKDDIKAELGKFIKKNLVQKQKFTQERDSLSAKIAGLNQELTSLQNDLNISLGEKDNIKAELGKFIKKNLVQKQKSTQERDSLSAKIADLNQELTSLQNDLNVSRGEKDNIKAELGKFIKKNLVQKQKSTQERDSLFAKIANLNQELASLQNDLNVSRGEKDNIKAELGKFIKKNLVQKQKSTQERDSLSAKIADLNHELVSTQQQLHEARQISKQAHEDLQKTKCEKFELTEALNATTHWMGLMKTKAELQDKITKDCIESNQHLNSIESLAPLDPEKNGAVQLESLISQNEITTHRHVKAVPTWRDKLYNFFYPSAPQ